MEVTILGSGGSTGVPIPGCECPVCLSNDKRNKRLRPSILIKIENPAMVNILIDSTPDLRYQALRSQINKIDAVVYTHTHADHIFGMDDLRIFSFIKKHPIPVYASKESLIKLVEVFNYIFFHDPEWQGGALPNLTFNEITPYQPINLFGIKVLPITIKHANAEILGFRFNNFAYLTDCSFIPEKTREYLKDLDVLILSGLRYSNHPSHFSLKQAAEEIEKINPKKSYLTHLSHEVDYTEGNKYLCSVSKLDIELAYDQLTLKL